MCRKAKAQIKYTDEYLKGRLREQRLAKMNVEKREFAQMMLGTIGMLVCLYSGQAASASLREHTMKKWMPIGVVNRESDRMNVSRADDDERRFRSPMCFSVEDNLVELDDPDVDDDYGGRREEADVAVLRQDVLLYGA